MILSTEKLSTGQVAIYARFNDQDEELEKIEFADEVEGETSPDKMLVKLIRRTYEARFKNE